jgi:hypothetical protein
VRKGDYQVVTAIATADNLMYRHCHFGTDFREVHGYLPLLAISEDQYDGCYSPGGQTHLYDNTDRVIVETTHYAEQQTAQKYLCNGFIYMLTDGCDYGSTLKQTDVRTSLAKAIASEALESLITILIGVNDDDQIQKDLQAYAANAGFTQYIPLKDASAATLAKLAKFISKSVVAQSQAVGSGGPSRSLIFLD